jgi:hypothetical protein
MAEQDREHAFAHSTIPDNEYLVFEFHHTPPQARRVCTGILGIKRFKHVENPGKNNEVVWSGGIHGYSGSSRSGAAIVPDRVFTMIDRNPAPMMFL